MLKILQARLQQYVNHELLDVQAGFRKCRGTRDKLPTSAGSLKKQEFQKNIYFCFMDYAKTFDCVDNNKLWKILKAGTTRQPDLPLRNLYACQEAIVRTGHGTANLIYRKAVHQCCILSPCLFYLYAECTLW